MREIIALKGNYPLGLAVLGYMNVPEVGLARNVRVKILRVTDQKEWEDWWRSRLSEREFNGTLRWLEHYKSEVMFAEVEYKMSPVGQG